MNYRFDLKSSQVYLLLGGLVAAGALLFLVGMLLGTSSAPPQAETTQVEGLPGAATAEPSTEPGTASIDTPAEEQADAAMASRDESTAPLPIPPQTSSEQRIYELQLSAHLDQQAAQPVLQELSSANLEPYLVETTDSRDRRLFTVRLGPWESMAEAAEAARAFREHGDFDAYEPVIRHRPKPLGTPSGQNGSG